MCSDLLRRRFQVVAEALVREDPAHVDLLLRELVSRQIAAFRIRRHRPARRKAQPAILLVLILDAGQPLVDRAQNRRRAPGARTASLRFARRRMVEEEDAPLVTQHHLRQTFQNIPTVGFIAVLEGPLREFARRERTDRPIHVLPLAMARVRTEILIRRVDREPFRKGLGRRPPRPIFVDHASALVGRQDAAIQRVGVAHRETPVLILVLRRTVQWQLVAEEPAVPEMFHHICAQPLRPRPPRLRLLGVAETFVHPGELPHRLIDAGVVAVHRRHRLVQLDRAVLPGNRIGREVPRVDRIRTLAETVRGIPALDVARLVVDALLETRQRLLEPGVVTRHAPGLQTALDHQVFDVRLEFETHERLIVLGIEDATVGVHISPVEVVQLLDELVELPVRALRVENEVKEAREIVLPMAVALHLVDVVADPVELAHQNAAIDEDLTAVRPHDLPEMPQGLAEVVVTRRQHARIREFPVVVGAAGLLAAAHARQRVLKRDRPTLVDLQSRRIRQRSLRQRLQRSLHQS